MVLMVNFFTNTPCNNGLHIAVQGAVEKFNFIQKMNKNKNFACVMLGATILKFYA